MLISSENFLSKTYIMETQNDNGMLIVHNICNVFLDLRMKALQAGEGDFGVGRQVCFILTKFYTEIWV